MRSRHRATRPTRRLNGAASGFSVSSNGTPKRWGRRAPMGCRTERYALAGGHLNHATETTHETGSSDECRAAAPRGATDWDGGLASLGHLSVRTRLGYGTRGL